MGFIEAIRVFFKKYSDFSGRGRRSEFWYSYLFTYLAVLLIFLSFAFLMVPFQYDRLALQIIATFGGLAVCGILIPYLAAMSRRLHDTNRSFSYAFMALIPLVGPIFLLVALATDGEQISNRFGQSVK
jgi:uncharacterized membrane protein YhaH (DUF805 family)